MSLFFRRISVLGRFPFVRLIQIWNNPAYLLHILKKNIIYKRSTIDFEPKYEGLTFLSGMHSLEALISGNKSLARFSDGEFEQLTGGGEYPPDSDWCQKWSPSLQRDLEATLACTDPRLLVAVDPPTTFLAPRDSAHHIRFEYNMWVDMRRLMWTFLTPGHTYGHSHLFIKANCPDLDWSVMRQHFANKDIIIATGNTQKLKGINLGRRTFFVECGTENAYERKDNIKQAIHKVIQTEGLDKASTIVLASLGPTAGILAHQMLSENIRVWDTGHMFAYAAKNFLETTFAADGAA